jgi:hypothetical protein
MARGPAPRRRGERRPGTAAGHLHSLLHGDKAEAADADQVRGGLELEADAVVADLEVDPVALDGPVVQLGGDVHPFLLGRLHGPVEHPPALGGDSR